MTLRLIPLPMKSKVKEEHARMKKLGVIRKVDKHTNWCARIATASKPNGKIRICVGLRKLNENVCRETCPLPKIDALLGEYWNDHNVHENWRKFRVWTGEASRKLSTSNRVSDSLWQTLFSATSLWFKISTRKIPKENAKEAGKVWRGDMHHGWHPCAW